MTRTSRTPHAEPHDLAIYDGQTCIGHIEERNGIRTATSWPDERALGTFTTRKAACDAIGAARLLRELTERAAA